jgi:hypothetical protein
MFLHRAVLVLQTQRQQAGGDAPDARRLVQTIALQFRWRGCGVERHQPVQPALGLKRRARILGGDAFGIQVIEPHDRLAKLLIAGAVGGDGDPLPGLLDGAAGGVSGRY